MALSLEDRTAEYLATIQDLETTSSRRGFLYVVFGSAEFLRSVDYEGPSREFCRNLVERSNRLGTLADGRNALEVLLVASKTPDLGQDAQQLCDELVAEWSIRRRGRPTPNAIEPEPYKGLDFFDVRDADLFFGRDRLTVELVAYLCNHRLLAVVGASGSGKSSVVRAGLAPALKTGKHLEEGDRRPRSCDRWPVHIITPTAQPLRELAVTLTRDSESVTAATMLIDALLQDQRSLDIFARRLLKHQDSNDRLLLIVDQFEELFTLCRDRDERKAFVDNLLMAAAPDGVVTVVLTLRADFYAHCAEFENLRAALSEHQIYIGAMTKEELRTAIEQPAAQDGWELEPGLVDLMLEDVEDESGALPLLSHALLETWIRRSGRILTLAGYQAAGRVQGAIAKTADSTLAGLTPEQKEIARSIFLRLTELGEGVQDTRRRVPLEELMPGPDASTDVVTVLQTLQTARLVTTVREEVLAGADVDIAPRTYVDVAHEALIREWPALREWLADDREGLGIHRRLTRATEEWNSFGHDTGLLYRGAKLAQTAEWAATHRDVLNRREDEFLSASQHEQALASRNLMRQRYILAGIAAVALILATALTIIGILSQEQRRELRSRELAGYARTSLEQDPELSVLLAREASVISNTDEAEEALRAALQQSRLVQVVPGPGIPSTYAAFSPDHELFAISDSEGNVEVRSLITGEQTQSWQIGSRGMMLQFSPVSGQLLAAVDETGGVTVWEVTSGNSLAAIQVDPNGGVLTGLAFSPDERLLATIGYDRILRLWEIATQRKLAEAETFVGYRLAFSPNGEYLVVASYYGEISVLDAGLETVYATWTGHERTIVDVAFHPDSRQFATAGADSKVKIWDMSSLDDMQPRYAFDAHSSTITDVAFNADGKCLVTTSYDHTAKVWRGPGVKLVTVFAGRPLLGADFADPKPMETNPVLEPCGLQLRTVDGTGALQTWNIGASVEYRTLTAHTAGVEAIALAPDGHTFATGDDGGNLLLWHGFDQPPSRWKLHTGKIMGIDFGRDGRHLATASEDGTVKILDLGIEGASPQTLEMQDDSGDSVPLNSVAFRPPDGRQLVVAGQDGVIRLWDVDSGNEVSAWPLHDPRYGVASVAFNRDGSQLVTAGIDGVALVWDVDQACEVRKLSPDELAPIYVAVFSPDEKTIVTGDANGHLRFWSLESDESWPVSAHPGPIFAVEFGPDSRLFATTGSDGRAIIWESATRKRISVLNGNLAAVAAARFMDSPDGPLLVTAGDDNSVRAYLVRDADLATYAAKRVKRPWSEEECFRYLDKACSLQESAND